MTDSNAPRRYLQREQAARIPSDLDLDAIDELLVYIPIEHHDRFMALFMASVPPTGLETDWAADAKLGTDDSHLRAIVDRIYAARRGTLPGG